jgi:endoglucanase
VVSQAQQDADVVAFYNVWKADYLVGVPQSVPLQCRIAFGRTGSNRSRTVSEGQGYGMMIVALMAGHDPHAQAIFSTAYGDLSVRIQVRLIRD